MSEHINAKIIAFVGLVGSGRTTAIDYLTEKGHPKVSFKSIIQNALKEAGLDPTLDNEKLIRDKLYNQDTSDGAVDQIVRQLNDLVGAGQHHIVIDGLGSWQAYKSLKHQFPGDLITVAILAPRDIRHRRMTERAETPMTAQDIDQRDYDEIETLNKGGVIALADHFIMNNASLDEYNKAIDDILQKTEF